MSYSDRGDWQIALIRDTVCNHQLEHGRGIAIAEIYERQPHSDKKGYWRYLRENAVESHLPRMVGREDVTIIKQPDLIVPSEEMLAFHIEEALKRS